MNESKPPEDSVGDKERRPAEADGDGKVTVKDGVWPVSDPPTRQDTAKTDEATTLDGVWPVSDPPTRQDTAKTDEATTLDGVWPVSDPPTDEKRGDE